MQPDTIIPNLYNPQSLNRYSYVNNNPINFNDPTGHVQQADDSSSCVTENCATPEELAELFNRGQKDKKWKEENGCAAISSMGICIDPSGEYIQNEKNDQEAEDAIRYARNSALAVTAVYVTPAAIELLGQGGPWLTMRCLMSAACRAVTGMAGGAGVSKLDDLVQQAQQQYPNKAGKIELHHVFPKYLGGPADGEVAALDAAYHQVITNAFRALWKYGQGAPTTEQAQSIMQQVYDKFPLP